MITESIKYLKGQLYGINLTDLRADPNQPRKYMDPEALEELAASIREHGILEPILFRQATDGTLRVVAGERRCAAAQKAGLTNIPALCV
jgi:ParB family transcriptional regulator, chromosome partitioning protein